jgi:hypothetical protein
LVTSKTIVPDAKTFGEKKFKDRIKFIDQYEIAKLLLQYNLKIHEDINIKYIYKQLPITSNYLLI